MSIEFIYPEFEVIRNENRCITCRICQQQCANGVHSYNSETKQMVCDESNCVNCQRCVSFCPTRALKIVKSDCSLRENANWSENMMKEIYKQAPVAIMKRNYLMFHTMAPELAIEDLKEIYRQK